MARETAHALGFNVTLLNLTQSVSHYHTAASYQCPSNPIISVESFVLLAIALVCKYVTRGWKEVQAAYSDKENSEEVAKVLSYLEVVEKVKHSCDETEVINLIEEHQLEREQLLTDHLKSKQVSAVVNRDL